MEGEHVGNKSVGVVVPMERRETPGRLGSGSDLEIMVNIGFNAIADNTLQSAATAVCRARLPQSHTYLFQTARIVKKA